MLPNFTQMNVTLMDIKLTSFMVRINCWKGESCLQKKDNKLIPSLVIRKKKLHRTKK